MDKILVSACLLGEKTRYDGKDNLNETLLQKLTSHYEVVPFCPEVEGGLSVPRLKSEIRDGRVVNEKGEDVTSYFVRGAEKAVEICRFLGISIAILKDGSPSCGSRRIHDGKFTGNKIDGLGVTAQKLIEAGVKVYADTDGLDFLFPERKRSERPYMRENPAERKRAYRKKRYEGEKKEGTSAASETAEGGEKKEFRAHKPFHKGFKGKSSFHGKGSFHGKEGSSFKGGYRKKDGAEAKGGFKGKSKFRGKSSFHGRNQEEGASRGGYKKGFAGKKKFFYSTNRKTSARQGYFARKKKEQ